MHSFPATRVAPLFTPAADRAAQLRRDASLLDADAKRARDVGDMARARTDTALANELRRQAWALRPSTDGER